VFKIRYDLASHETLKLKPDYKDAVRRYEAFWNGSMEDRPVVRITVPNPDRSAPLYESNYYAKINDDEDELVQGLVGNAGRTLYFGEALPEVNLSFGCEEIAVYCGGALRFHENDRDTNWAQPFVMDWEDVFPIRINEGHPMWLRKLSLAEKCAKAMDGVMLFSPIDLLTNMDLLQGMRGSEGLCKDLLDRPETIDRALAYVMEIVGFIYDKLFMPYGLPSASGFDHLQCDFSYMIGGPMFRRFVLPYLEREAEYFNNRVLYHWDGPGALTHTEDLLASKYLYLLGYVPGAGKGTHKDYIDLYKKVQARGKAVCVWGDPDEMKLIHRELSPEKTIYSTQTETAREAEELLKWFAANT